jgi:UDP-N-acetylmuramoyl-L-alanyl-D-glutamate--2,6-diaminopimelate ligase
MKLIKFTGLEVLTYAVNNHKADVYAIAVKNSINGIEMDVKFKNKAAFRIKSKLCGYFNVYNIIASVGTCLKIGIGISDIQAGIDMMTGVSGRFEKVDLKNNVNVIVDYAHTPDGLEKVLSTAKSLLLPDGRLISVFGCGGDRDKQKRKIMGKISAEIADFTIITSDNPRTEEPESIIKMIEEGFLELHCGKYSKEIDRKKAIYKALNMATGKDIVLIAGKGHEEYQEFANRRIHFVDQEVVREWSDK